MSEDLKQVLESKLGVLDTAFDSTRFAGMTIDEFVQYLANHLTTQSTHSLGGVSSEELLAFFMDPNGKVLDADRVGGYTVEDLLTEVKQRIKEASHPYVTLPLSRGGWSRIVTVPATYIAQYEKIKTTDEDLLFVLIGGGPYGFLAERPVAYLRIGREGRPPVVNVLSGRYTVDFFYRKVKVDNVDHIEIWCGDAARNDFQILLLGGDRGCKFGVKERPLEEKPEGNLVSIRRETVVQQSYMDKVLDGLRQELEVLHREIQSLQE